MGGMYGMRASSTCGVWRSLTPTLGRDVANMTLELWSQWGKVDWTGPPSWKPALAVVTANNGWDPIISPTENFRVRVRGEGWGSRGVDSFLGEG
jgi:hypothetical protein